MVGGNDIYLSFDDSTAQGIAVGLSFDGGVAFDAGAQHFIVAYVEQQMSYTGFGGDSLVFVQRCMAEQRQFLGCGDMQHVQACPGFCGQLDSQMR